MTFSDAFFLGTLRVKVRAMFGSNHSICKPFLATDSLGQMKWQTDSKVAPAWQVCAIFKCSSKIRKPTYLFGKQKQFQRK